MLATEDNRTERAVHSRGDLVTGSVAFEGVESAFAALADPHAHAEILVDPKNRATVP